MDYKYINQLLERYWRCETSLEEEDILRAFFSQDSVPADLMRYKPLFNYAEVQKEHDVLGEEFDEKILSVIEGSKPVKARVITMAQRFKPLFKAAAVVAIILTLGNAMQLPFGNHMDNPIVNYDGYSMPKFDKGTSVALGDSAMSDTMKQSMVEPSATVGQPIIK
ncbi:hypothetical protein HMPREF0645_0390 [Hallella bergensis DSM 17361]|uniref:Pyruvate ferredoxin oxidoreductase n=1 Tax=Hallella bergensis DSM 17361 TaxID=585502 RepID=D1PTV5_9BACT|nr:hypothetical protein [Hallella bergensis]EFA45163.1 hypothetical protein HMPREF0645_0390 [Hallella bergensis DSM 17361]